MFCPRLISSVITRGNAQSSTSNGLSGNPGITNLANFSGSKSGMEGLPWWSHGSDFVLPLQGARVSSLVGELRSRIPARCGQKKEKKSDMGNLF